MTPEPNIPRNIEAEAALLGGMLIEPRVLDLAADRLAGDDFFEPLHGRIFDLAVTLRAQGAERVTPVTLAPYFKDDEAMAAVGGPGYMAQLTASAAALVGARDFITQIADLAVRRRLMVGLQDVVGHAQQTNGDVSNAALAEMAEQVVVDADRKHGDANVLDLAACMDQVMDEWGKPATGVLSGCIAPLDKAMGRSRPDDLIILAGRPAMGKTAAAISYGVGVARQALSPDEQERADGGGVAFISLEMSGLQIGQRTIADLAAYSSPINFSTVTNGWLGETQKAQVRRIRDEAAKIPFTVVDTASLTVPRLDGMVRRLARSFEAKGIPLRLVIVDYLQLMNAGRTTGNRTEEVTMISRGLKQIAKRHKIAVMALSQLSRAVELRENKRPILADLRESGSIEQDADKIVFLFRESYYHEKAKPMEGSKGYETAILDWEAGREALQDKIEFIIAKRRDGPEGTAVGRYVREHQAVRGDG